MNMRSQSELGIRLVNRSGAAGIVLSVLGACLCLVGLGINQNESAFWIVPFFFALVLGPTLVAVGLWLYMRSW